jgi:hypothetical protein
MEVDKVEDNMDIIDQAVLAGGTVLEIDGVDVVVASVCVKEITLIAAKGCILY